MACRSLPVPTVPTAMLVQQNVGQGCAVPEHCSCSERSERAERSEHVWPQIVRNICPKSAKIKPKPCEFGQHRPKSKSCNLGMSVLILSSNGDIQRSNQMCSQDQHAQAQDWLRHAQAQLMHAQAWAQAQHWIMHAQAWAQAEAQAQAQL